MLPLFVVVLVLLSLCRPILVLHCPKNVFFTKAHFFASGLSQCSTWGPLSTTLYSTIHVADVQVYRIATKNVFNPTLVFLFVL